MKYLHDKRNITCRTRIDLIWANIIAEVRNTFVGNRWSSKILLNMAQATYFKASKSVWEGNTRINSTSLVLQETKSTYLGSSTLTSTTQWISHFSRNSSISGWFNRARQQSRWIFIANKWTSEISDNSALIYGPFHRNRETRKDNNIDYRSNLSHADRTWSCGQYFMDRRRDNHRVQSTIDADCLGYGRMVKNSNCRNSTNCEVCILRNYFFLVA